MAKPVLLNGAVGRESGEEKRDCITSIIILWFKLHMS